MFKLDLVPLAPKLLQNRKAHIDYLKYTQEQADILLGIVKQAKTKQPSDNALDFTCCQDCSLVSRFRMFKTYDKEPLSAHELFISFNFGTLNKLAKDGLARGIPRLKFQKYHLCSACVLGKSKKSSHQPKAEDTNQEKLYLLHMDLCDPMRMTSINGKRYILVIVDDYSRFNLVRFLKSKDEAPEAICIENIQVRLNATNLQQKNLETIETIHVTFDELTTMASEQLGSGPVLQCMTPATSCSGLARNPIPQQPCIPPPRDDWDHLFQHM
uniref:Retrovirus-related Pol polyprotein from transposon TNT 1-94 n=1 Tax=Tanacetum cinerariifolium TaxID=118510 RepID=A0A6L2MZU6_TANCI|nr:hypothetical protein [Tanacetum cinerariifolium]